MITVENVSVWGFEHAIRGMRNPMNSWDKSDSHFHYNDCIYCVHEHEDCGKNHRVMYGGVCFNIGENDLDLMRRLYKAGNEHRKFLRQIFVCMDITAPLYWWKEFDTYKVGTVANSCSTMHKIHAKKFTLDDFSCEHLINDILDETCVIVGEIDELYAPKDVLEFIIRSLNVNRDTYLKTNDKKYWWQMIQLLPSSYNQKRTITMNYENVVNIINQRQYHKLDEWIMFVQDLKALPYIREIRGEE